MEKKIRILHVAQAGGGVDRYIRMLLKYLNHAKFENVLVCSDSYKQEDYNGLVIAFEQIGMQRPIGAADIKAAHEVRALIKKYKPDIVYAHSSKAGAITRMADIGLNNICIYNPHGWAFNMKGSQTKQRLYALIEKIAAPFCDQIICISEAEKQSALDKKICKANKLQVILNGVDVEEYEQEKAVGQSLITREHLCIPKDAYVVGMVGRISQQKAPDTFIKVAEQIKKEIQNAYFIIVGDGEQRSDIEQYAQEHSLADSLLITGWVENPMEYIDLFDIAMLLSRWEGFGLVLPEYMLAGKPIVATRVDAIPNIIQDGENGLLVDVDDVEGASRAIIRLHDDILLTRNLTNRGRITVHERYDARRVSQESGMLFEKVITDKQ